MNTIRHVVETASTNHDAYQLALQGAEHGFAVIADSQSGGRGRLGREWVSPAGKGLYCSIILRPRLEPVQFPQITLMAGLSLCQMVESLGPENFGLKWPNDLYCKGKKCGGILVESSPLNEPPKSLFVIVGIGLNVNAGSDDFPDHLKDSASSLFLQTGRQWLILDLYQKLHNRILENLTIHEKQGFPPILAQWRQRDVLLGRKMQWVTQDKRLISGRGLGPDEEGRLLVEDCAGRIHEILSGDVRLLQKENDK